MDAIKENIFFKNFGGSSVARGFSLFRTDPEVAEWIETFEKTVVLLI